MPIPLQLQRYQAAHKALQEMMASGVAADDLQTVLASLPQMLIQLGYLQTLALLNMRDKTQTIVLQALMDHLDKFESVPNNQDLRPLTVRALRFANSLKVLSKQPLPMSGSDDGAVAQQNGQMLNHIDGYFTNLSSLASSAAHQGLKFEKFFSSFQSMKGGKDAEWRLKWVQEFTGKSIGESKALSVHHADSNAIAVGCLGGLALPCLASSPLVVGLGYDHAIENGMLWHHTLGVPYLPASSIKGMLRTWMSEWSDAAETQDWFGSTSKAGRLTVFDALPSQPIRLEADVTTPHWGTWGESHSEPVQGKSINDFPADWVDPKPVHWLRAQKGSRLTFYLALKNATEQETMLLKEHLLSALQYLGLGAKTALGYGRFELDPKSSSSL